MRRYPLCLAALLATTAAAQDVLTWHNDNARGIEARLPDGTVRRTANFYYLNAAARIQRLSVYMRGG
jgi:hypothetical protein